MPRLKMNDIDNLFNELPNADDDKYTIELKNIVMNNNLVSNKDDLETYLTNLNSKHRFSAFYSLLIISREYNNYSDYNGYVEKFSSEFTKFKLNKIILSTYCRNKAVLGDKDEYFKAIKFAEEACELMPTNLAVKHHFAAMIVLAIEEKVNVDKNDINKAINRLDDVIIAFPKNAIYICTQGRLFAAIGNYNQGIINLKKALDLENGLDKDSMIRIGEYNYYLIQIKMMMENDLAEEKTEKFKLTFQDIENNLDGIKTQYLEYLAFFSSVLAFILTTINIISKVEDFNKCAGIIFMFAGCLIVVFCAFRMLLYFSTKIKFGVAKIIICCLIGIIFIILGFFTGNHILLTWLK